MKWQQVLIDIGVLATVPALFFLGVTFLFDGTNSASLLLDAGSQPSPTYGTDVKSALDTLKKIDTTKWDRFFNSEEYKSLDEPGFKEIETVSLGRKDPFTPTAELQEKTTKKSLIRTP